MDILDAISYTEETLRALKALARSAVCDIDHVIIEDHESLSGSENEHKGGSVFFNHGMASACKDSMKINKEDLMNWADYDGVRMYEMARAGA